MNTDAFFDPSKYAELLKSYDMTKFFPSAQAPQIDPVAMIDAQKKNLDALVSANQKASDSYKALFEKQIKTFEATMTEARKHVEAFDATDMSPEAAQKQSEFAQAAFEKALKNMTVLAEEAQKANAEAYKIVASRIEDSVKELQSLTQKMTS